MPGRGTRAVPIEHIENRILLVRGHKVLLDSDLAALYGVETRVLNQAVKRNPDRFPRDFMFRLSANELEAWRSQFVISKPSAKMGIRRAPYAFTEHGALMAAPVLKRLEEHERKLARHDQAIAGVMSTIRSLLEPRQPPRRRPIGFIAS
jgi:hypothetical protein